MESSQDNHVRWDEYVTQWLHHHIGSILLVLYLLLLCIAIPLTTNELVQRHAEVRIILLLLNDT